MIQVVQGFKLSTRDAVDSRLVLSKAEMAAINDNQMPEKYFAICKDDGCLYLYDKSRVIKARDVNADDTGKFEQFSSSPIESISINGVEVEIIDKNVNLPAATNAQLGMMMAGTGLTSTDGVITLDFNAIDDKAIPFEKIDFDNVIIDASNISII